MCSLNFHQQFKYELYQGFFQIHKISYTIALHKHGLYVLEGISADERSPFCIDFMVYLKGQKQQGF